MSVKSDRKLGDAAKLKTLELELSRKDGAIALELPDTVNQSVKKNASGSLTLTISRGGAKKQVATEQDRKENLESTLRYPSQNEEVKALAQKATEGAKDDAEKVKKLLRFTDEFLRDSYEVEALTVMDLLKSRKGDCSAHALLFTALARAAGVPAREAGGWLYMGDAYQRFGGHAWNEVVLDGQWVPVDSNFQEFQLDAGHIQEKSGEKNENLGGFFNLGLQAKVLSSSKE